jgi:hypothetical protein
MVIEEFGANRNPPTVYIEIPKRFMKEIEGLDVNDSVTITLRGRLKSISKSAGRGGKTGSISVQVMRMAVRDAGGAFEQLADEDEG